MKHQLFHYLFLILISFSASAQENRNQYSNSLMFEAPPVYEDIHQQSETEQQNQFCQELQQQIKDLKNKPVRHSAARERYQKECVGN